MATGKPLPVRLGLCPGIGLDLGPALGSDASHSIGLGIGCGRVLGCGTGLNLGIGLGRGRGLCLASREEASLPRGALAKQKVFIDRSS